MTTLDDALTVQAAEARGKARRLRNANPLAAVCWDAVADKAEALAWARSYAARAERGELGQGEAG